jgi:integrase
VKGRPKTLGAQFVDDLLEVTGGGRARDFETARDHAIIRILRIEGIRRSELLGMVMHTLHADVIKNQLIRLVPLKGARVAGEGRLISLAPSSARVFAIYLRARRQHKLADSEWVWLGTRNRGRLQITSLHTSPTLPADLIIQAQAIDAEHRLAHRGKPVSRDNLKLALGIATDTATALTHVIRAQHEAPAATAPNDQQAADLLNAA